MDIIIDIEILLEIFSKKILFWFGHFSSISVLFRILWCCVLRQFGIMALLSMAYRLFILMTHWGQDKMAAMFLRAQLTIKMRHSASMS